MYKLNKNVKNKIRHGQQLEDMTFDFFDPTTFNPQLRFNKGPESLLLPEEDPLHPDYFNLTQLVMIFTDMKNWLSDYSSSFSFEFLVEKWFFRLKHCKIGYVPYFPESWIQKIDLQKDRIQRILARFCGGEDGLQIAFDKLALVLCLLRYPMPSEEQVQSVQQQISEIVDNKPEDQKFVSFEEFLTVNTWMDQFDEKMSK